MIKTSAEFRQRATESKRAYDNQLIHIELLKRNKIFLSELAGVIKRLGKDYFEIVKLPNSKALDEMFRRDFPKVKYVLRNFKGPIDHYLERDPFFDDFNIDYHFVEKMRDAKYPKSDRAAKWDVFTRYKNKWEIFCERWGISDKWGGKLNNLSKFAETICEIWIDVDEFPLSIIIKISPWASFKNLEELWPDIERAQKGFRAKTKESFTFGRDLFWYDLRQKGWTYGKIAKRWTQYYPENIKLMAAKKLTKRHKDLLGKTQKGNDINELINELESNDPSIQDLINEYNQYITDYSRTYYSDLIEIIKKAIKKINEGINNYPTPEHIETAGIVGTSRLFSLGPFRWEK
jgi:hypothetical protein